MRIVKKASYYKSRGKFVIKDFRNGKSITITQSEVFHQGDELTVKQKRENIANEKSVKARVDSLNKQREDSFAGLNNNDLKHIRFNDWVNKMIDKRVLEAGDRDITRTIAKYNAVRKKFNDFLIENGYESNIWLHDITLDISEDFLTWLKNYNPNVRGRLKSSTIYSYFKHYKYIIARAVKKRYLDSYRADVDLPKYTSKQREGLSIEEINNLERTPFDVTTARLFFLFSCYSGIPFKEAQNLKFRDFNKYEDGYIMVYKRNKTQKYIKVAINHKALPYYKEAKRLYFKNINSNVFPNLNYSGNLNHKIQDWVNRANINKKITPHSARASFAVNLYRASKDPKLVQESLGHEDYKTTQRYVNAAMECQINGAKTFNNWVNSKEKETKIIHLSSV